MQSLLSSKLYGTTTALSRVAPSCNPGTATPSGCVAPCETGVVCSGCTGSGALTAGRAATSGNGPGKHNFIGFGDDNCTLANLASRQILGEEGATPTTQDANCNIDVDSYEMGVWGHIAGKEYFGVSVNNNGVVSTEEINTTPDTAKTNCT